MYLYILFIIYMCVIMCCFILSACQRDLAFSESRRQKGPPRTTIDGLCTMRSRDGYNVSLRFCDRRSIFHFSINPAAHNTINDIQKLFSDRVCNFTLPLHLQYPPRHFTTRRRRFWVPLYIMRILYKLNSSYVYVYRDIAYYNK